MTSPESGSFEAALREELMRVVRLHLKDDGSAEPPTDDQERNTEDESQPEPPEEDTGQEVDINEPSERSDPSHE